MVPVILPGTSRIGGFADQVDPSSIRGGSTTCLVARHVHHDERHHGDEQDDRADERHCSVPGVVLLTSAGLIQPEVRPHRRDDSLPPAGPPGTWN